MITEKESRLYGKAIQNYYSNVMTRLTFDVKSAVAMLLIWYGYSCFHNHDVYLWI